jgi:predicted nucleic acid-binding protein
LIDTESAFITDVINYELLVGTKTPSDLVRMKSFVSAINFVSLFPMDMDGFSNFAILLRKKGLLGTFADTSIAYLAAREKLAVLSLDSYFLKLGDAGMIETL